VYRMDTLKEGDTWKHTGQGSVTGWLMVMLRELNQGTS
jgi:hypothetical protein